MQPASTATTSNRFMITLTTKAIVTFLLAIPTHPWPREMGPQNNKMLLDTRSSYVSEKALYLSQLGEFVSVLTS